MNPGEEWLIKRGLKVRKIDETKTKRGRGGRMNYGIS